MATIDDHLLRVRLLLARVNPSAAFRSPDNSILRRALWDLYSILEGPLQKEMYEIWKLCNAPAKFSQGLARLSAFLEAHPSSSPSGPTSMALAPSAGDHLASLGAQSSSLPENTTAAPVSREEFLPSRSPIVSRHPDSLTVSLRRGESPTNGLRRLLRNERLSQIGDYPGKFRVFFGLLFHL
ncbi:uncharacterized protein EI90DRAFT_184152 [Cantharellus anzutake]|uniref:uncharacterized protein n=1 Tax=Cantharellus anzutake TaxID=1750568 RepID=UPI001908958D|nr:uncharacterized protein EI90DRAFT_184152 [Cantharellus anzutake]KAF8336519.1 hypothetical protein EI90DRAFT_184152 [Cantharellus anzutake]